MALRFFDGFDHVAADKTAIAAKWGNCGEGTATLSLDTGRVYGSSLKQVYGSLLGPQCAIPVARAGGVFGAAYKLSSFSASSPGLM